MDTIFFPFVQHVDSRLDNSKSCDKSVLPKIHLVRGIPKTKRSKFATQHHAISLKTLLYTKEARDENPQEPHARVNIVLFPLSFSLTPPPSMKARNAGEEKFFFLSPYTVAISCAYSQQQQKYRLPHFLTYHATRRLNQSSWSFVSLSVEAEWEIFSSAFDLFVHDFQRFFCSFKNKCSLMSRFRYQKIITRKLC